ncbi:glucose dehydrogenase [FAD, quinone]-like [Trichogramma pretiosum]|uniref:glucose dehydrogenase [FAD, quinone]-like n=1 Tax=Trichogramma pretiosum TaxID=7493 RepID=UPI0006C9BF56|nr:glucose dehydrogenase [FAD, quinone]-like [Trichogramma pretiosum]XP_014235110.1 glucose dehydrogenase [FAD, quinone]-like [Trichogramma pretiosum]
MVWTHNGALCAPGKCNASMLTFLTLLAQYLGTSFDSHIVGFDDGSTDFDFVIVGAGSAGCVVANRLSEEKSFKVLLLEAGDEEPAYADVPGLVTYLRGTNLDYGYTTQPEPQACMNQPNRQCSWTRGKVMGGSSVFYSMHFVRGNKWDYDNWANQVGDGRWTWPNILSYFKRSEDLRIPRVMAENPYSHGVGGYQTIEGASSFDPNAKVIMAGWNEVGLKEIDYNSGNNLGTSRMQYATIHGARQSSNGAYIRPIRGTRHNLIVRSNSKATKLIIDPTTKTITGVEYAGVNGELKVANAKKEVILSAGAIDSPKLLMLSGIGPAETLKESNVQLIHDLPGVGKNLQNHFSITPISVKVPENSKPFNVSTMQNDLIHWMNTHEGPMSVNPFMDNIAFLKTRYEPVADLPDIQVGYLKYKYDQDINGPRVLLPYYDGFWLTTLALSPKSRGELKLDPSDPLNKQPLIHANYFSNPHDIKVVAEGARLTKLLTETRAFKEAGFEATRIPYPHCDELEYATDPYYECLAKNYTGIIYHFVGTCKMGSLNDKSAVVDSTLKVMGMKGLRVIDASIMPELTRGNTHAPTLAIAELGSDMIKDDWLKGPRRSWAGLFKGNIHRPHHHPGMNLHYAPPHPPNYVDLSPPSFPHNLPNHSLEHFPHSYPQEYPRDSGFRNSQRPHH